MIELYRYTDKEKKELVDSLTILVDTREKTSHIIEYFDKKKVLYKYKKLDYGDYSFMIPKNEKLGILKDIYFDKKVIIEKKGNLEEISGNLTNDRARLEKEFSLSPQTKVMLIENASYSDIINNNYNTQYNRRSFLASLHTFWFRYNIPIFFMPKNEHSGIFIKMYFEYYLKEFLN